MAYHPSAGAEVWQPKPLRIHQKYFFVLLHVFVQKCEACRLGVEGTFPSITIETIETNVLQSLRGGVLFMTPYEKYELLTDENKEIIARQIETLKECQSERQLQPYSQE